MKRFAIRRAMEPTTTRREIDANALQMLMVLSSGLSRRDLEDWDNRQVTEHVSWLDASWVRTYWHPGGDAAMCLYTGPTKAGVADANLICGAPFEDIHEVMEFAAPDRENPLTGHASPSVHGASLFWVECTLRPGLEASANLWASLPDVLDSCGIGTAPSYLDGSVSFEWVRTYWREEGRWFLALYAASDGEWLQTAPACGFRHGPAIIRPVEEIAPADYLG